MPNAEHRATALVCIAPGSEELEAVTVLNLLARAGIRTTLASVDGDGALPVTCSRGTTLLADAALIDVADQPFDMIVLPGGLGGAEYFARSELLTEKVRQMHLEGRWVAAICATPVLFLQARGLFADSNMTCYPSLLTDIPEEHRINKRVTVDPRFNLITSQGPATSIDFALKIINTLCGKETAAQVADELVLPPGIYNYAD
ncbi:protein deglycase YajL [Plesiomonas shigelloides]|uniref:protein deglycase YajL n=1 Tax=Plesiomonas shigelloides TaxID=703 RepID=UPI00326036F4